MKLIKPSVEILDELHGDTILKILERVARTCYKSEDKITDNTDSAKRLLKTILTNRHASILEFVNVTVKFTCSIGCAREITRHRIGSYSQESTRYCNYTQDKFGNQLTFIIPEWANLEEGEYHAEEVSNLPDGKEYTFARFALAVSDAYRVLVEYDGRKPEEAREVLPLCTKTEINVQYNLREWMHFFELRCSNHAHPEIRNLAKTVLNEFHNKIPLIFDELYERYIEQPNSKG